MFYPLTISHSHVADNFVLPTIRPPFDVNDIYIIADDSANVHIPFPIISEARQQYIPVVSLIGLVNSDYEEGNPTNYILRRRGGEIPYHTAVLEYASIFDMDAFESLYRPYIKSASRYYSTVIVDKFFADALTLNWLSTSIAIMLTNRYFPQYDTERKIDLVSTLMQETYEYVESNYTSDASLEDLLKTIANNDLVEDRVTKLNSLTAFNALFSNAVNAPHRLYILAGIESISAFGSIVSNYVDNTAYSRTPFSFTSKKIKKWLAEFKTGVTSTINVTNTHIK